MGGLGWGTAQLDDQVSMRPRYTIYNRLCGCRQLGVPSGNQIGGVCIWMEVDGSDTAARRILS